MKLLKFLEFLVMLPMYLLKGFYHGLEDGLKEWVDDLAKEITK